MFNRQEANATKKFEFSATMKEIPAEAPSNCQPMLEQLLTTMHLISEKYQIEKRYISARIDTAAPGTCYILLFNTAHGMQDETDDAVDAVNEAPITFLKNFLGEVTKEQDDDYSYYSSSVIMLSVDKLPSIIGCLTLLATPAAARRSRSVAKC